MNENAGTSDLVARARRRAATSAKASASVPEPTATACRRPVGRRESGLERADRLALQRAPARQGVLDRGHQLVAQRGELARSGEERELADRPAIREDARPMNRADSRAPRAGNTFDKYGSDDPLVRRVMSGFFRGARRPVGAVPDRRSRCWTSAVARECITEGVGPAAGHGARRGPRR